MPDNKFSELFAAREKVTEKTTEKISDSDSASETEAAGVELPLETDRAQTGTDSPPDSATAESGRQGLSTQSRSSQRRSRNGGDQRSEGNEGANGGSNGSGEEETSGTSSEPRSEASEASGASSPVHKGDKAHKRPPGRPPGKRSNPDYEQATVYIRRDTHKAVKVALLQHEDPRQFSELVEDLLQQWVNS